MTNYVSIENWYQNESFDIEQIRKDFFFGAFAEKLKSKDDLMVFSAENARNPQLKVLVDNELFVDISFAVVSNKTFNEVQLGKSLVGNLIGMDECSEHSLQTVLICEKVKELVTNVSHACFSEFLRNVKVWAHSRQIYE